LLALWIEWSEIHKKTLKRRGSFPDRFRLLVQETMTTPPRWNLGLYLPLLRHKARSYKLAPRLRVQFEESDLVQETCLRACRRIEQCRAKTDKEFFGWLKKILANTLIDFVRRTAAQQSDINLEQTLHLGLDESIVDAKQFSPSSQAEHNELKLGLDEILKTLPKVQGAVFIQRELLGASVAEIAETLGRSERSVAGLLLRARLKLREGMKKFQ
jgi:RNA polymerase sigma-70 factor (ECF subfamily)